MIARLFGATGRFTPYPGKWYKSQGFEILTSIHPVPGKWKIENPSKQCSAKKLSTVRLVYEWPSKVKAGIPILLTSTLYNEEFRIKSSKLDMVTKHAMSIERADGSSEVVARDFLFDDNTHGDAVANDSTFSLSLTLEEPGEYLLNVIAKAPTFERNGKLKFTVIP